MRLPLSTEVIQLELKSAIDILSKWESDTRQIPGQDVPADADQIEEFFRQFAGELILVARKCEALAAISLGEAA
jgi:hypothetical protein